MFDVGSLNQKVGSFDQRNTENEPPIGRKGWLLFENGAKREIDKLGALVEPPRNAKELCSRKLVYWECRVKQATKRFDDVYGPLYSFLQINSETGHHYPPHELEKKLKELNVLKKEVKRCKRCLESAKEDWQQYDPAIAIAKAKKAVRQSCSDALKQLKAVRI